MAQRHDIINEQAKRADEDRRIELNGIHHYNWSYVQRTRGYGWNVVSFPFDVAFTREPTFTYGSQLVSITQPGIIPFNQGIVTRWLLDKTGKLYLGAQMVLTVDYRVSYGYLGNATSVAEGSLITSAIVSHILAFTGPGRHRTKQEVATAAQLVKDSPTGLSPGLF